MEFVEGAIYADRRGNEYKYLYKIGGVTVFEDAVKRRIAQHSTGRFRWDNQDHSRDIIRKK
jgi:hypothetical protein